MLTQAVNIATIGLWKASVAVLTAVHETIQSGGKNPQILITALYPVSSNPTTVSPKEEPPSHLHYSVG